MTPGTRPSRRVARAAPLLPALRADAFNEMTFAIARLPREIQTEPYRLRHGRGAVSRMDGCPAGALIPPNPCKHNTGAVRLRRDRAGRNKDGRKRDSYGRGRG